VNNFEDKKKPHCMLRCSGVGRWKACSEAQIRGYSCLILVPQCIKFNNKKNTKKRFFLFSPSLGMRTFEENYVDMVNYIRIQAKITRALLN
jgi:hypothetical protein